jgi:hypothetical protein
MLKIKVSSVCVGNMTDIVVSKVSDHYLLVEEISTSSVQLNAVRESILSVN